MKRYLLTFLIIAFAIPSTVFAQGIDIPEGDISGTWTKEDSPFRIHGNLKIPDDLTLTIEPGVEVIFQDYYRILVEGTIIAQGNPGDTILFTVADTNEFTNFSDTTGGWAGIDFMINWEISMNNNDSSIFDLCKFEFAKSKNNPELFDEYGGVFRIFQYSRIKIINCHFHSNYANMGGAIYANQSFLSILNCKFSNNTAIHGGAVLGDNANIELAGNVFIKNRASENAGAIGARGDSRFFLAGNIIFDNSAELSGGGIWIESSSMHGINNFITNNSAKLSGGGIHSDISYPFFANNIICNNSAVEDGGGLSCWKSEVFLFNNTISNNMAARGGGLQFFQSKIQSGNNIFYGNAPQQIWMSDNLSFADFDHCLVQGGMSGLGKEPGVDFYGRWDVIIDADPLFVSPTLGKGTGYNALEADWMLKTESPCINQGNPEKYYDLPDIDVYHNPRIRNNIVDIGAAETYIDLVTASGNISSNQLWIADTVLVLSDLVVDDDVTLTINPGTVVLFQGRYSLNIKGTLKALGTPLNPVTFTCRPDIIELGWKGLIFDNDGSMNNNDTSEIVHCIIEHGKKENGGGVWINFLSKLRISHSLFRFNHADAMGGAICCQYCGPVISQNIIMENHAAQGGGIASDHGTPVITGNHIERNHILYDGGGIFLVFSNAWVEGNFITNHESGIWGQFGNSRWQLFLNNIVVQNNNGIIIHDNDCVFINNTICNNTYNNVHQLNGNMVMYNTILRGSNSQISFHGENSRGTMMNCNVEGGEGSIFAGSGAEMQYENIYDDDPGFYHAPDSIGSEFETFPDDWKLLPVSSCINTGTNEIEFFGLPDMDFFDNPRVNDHSVDIGAIENQDGKPFLFEDITGAVMCAGDTFEFCAPVADTASFQWMKDGKDIPGATSAIYRIDSLTYQHDGTYICRVWNAYGSIETNMAFLIVKSPPEIYLEPESQWITHGNPLDLRVIASGTPPMFFMWFKDGKPVYGGEEPGVRINSFDYEHEGTYQCIIENVCGGMKSDPAILYVAPEICMVTVDTVTGNNFVIWEKNSDIAPITQYNIHRESDVAGIYDIIGSFHYDSLSVFVDTAADPTRRAYLYKITAIDTTGHETNIELCKPHKTIHLLTTINPDTKATQLDWDRYYGFNYGTFFIYRSSKETNFYEFDKMSSSSTTYTDLNTEKQEYFYRVGVEKIPSCVPTGKSSQKADTGPYSHSMSNIEDNRLQITNDMAMQLNVSLQIFPNPFTDHTTIWFPNPDNTEYQLIIRDLSGKAVMTMGKITENQIIINRGNLKSGYYLIEVLGDKIFRGKIIAE